MEGESQSSTLIENTNAKSTPTPSLMGVLGESSTPAPISTDTQTPISALLMDDDITMYKPKKLKSIVRNHFTRQQINEEKKAIYNYYKRMFSGKSKRGTTHLHDHLNRWPKLAHKDFKQLLVVKQTKEDGAK